MGLATGSGIARCGCEMRVDHVGPGEDAAARRAKIGAGPETAST